MSQHHVQANYYRQSNPEQNQRRKPPGAELVEKCRLGDGPGGDQPDHGYPVAVKRDHRPADRGSPAQRPGDLVRHQNPRDQPLPLAHPDPDRSPGQEAQLVIGVPDRHRGHLPARPDRHPALRSWVAP